MTDVISTRLKKKDIDTLNQIAKSEHIDRSALIRKFLLEQIKEYRMKKSSEKYRKGIISLAESAIEAEVTIYQMIEFCQKEQIFPPSSSDEEIKNEASQAERIFKSLNV